VDYSAREAIYPCGLPLLQSHRAFAESSAPCSRKSTAGASTEVDFARFRTGGEQRLSDFLFMGMCALREFVFLQKTLAGLYAADLHAAVRNSADGTHSWRVGDAIAG